MKKQGSVLIMVLLIASVLFLMGGAMLLGNSSSYRAAVLYSASAQARELALSGLEDARVKLMKDQHFPPPGAVDQTVFAYAETIADEHDDIVGRYEVRVDHTHAVDPYQVIMVESVGTSLRDGNVLARRQLLAEIDAAQIVRGGSAPNPLLFEIINLRDEGSLSAK